MSDESNVWEAGEAQSAGGITGAAVAPAETLPPVVDLFMETIEDFKVSWKGHLLAGLGLMVVAFPVLFILILVSVAPFFAGIISENEVLVVVGFLLYMFGILAATIVVMGPVMYAAYSMEQAHLNGATELGFGSGLSRLMERPVGAIGYQALASALGTIGFFFFIVGAWVAQILVSFALPAMVVHNDGVMAAVSRSFSHVKDNFMWHLGFWGLGFAVMMVAGNVPIVGYAIGLPFLANYTLRGYRAAFGSPSADVSV